MDLAALASSVFAFYMIVLANFLPELIGCRFQTLLRTSMLAKHIVGVILLFFLVVFVHPENADQNLAMLAAITVVVYVWFLMTTRCPFAISILTVILLLAVYILQSRYDRLKKEEPTQAQSTRTVQLVLVGIAAAFTLGGFIYYVMEKRAEYGDDFSFGTYIVGTPQCRNTHASSLMQTADASVAEQ